MNSFKEQLNTLKDITPSASWKESNRKFLLSQISNQETREIEHKGFFSIIHQPAWAVFSIFLILVVGGGVSARATKNIKPGNSLYIARVLSEKTQVAMTWNKEEKAKKDMKFAQIHAKDITDVLADPSFDHVENKEKAEKLTLNFRQNLNTVKEKMEEINKIRKENRTQDETKEDDIMVSLGNIEKNDEGKIHTVDSGKGDEGMEFYETDFGKEEKPLEKEEKEPEEIKIIPMPIIETITSTEEIIIEQATTTENTIEDTIKKAGETLEAKDFEETKNMLEKVDEIINRMEEEGIVKGVEEVQEEQSTSTSE